MSELGPRARLLAKVGELRGAAFDIAGEATIGRSRSNAVVLQVAGVSGKHARIYYDPEAERFTLEDLGSRNGTELDGLPVTRPERLGRMHVIRFAGTQDLIYLGPEIAADLPALEPGEAPPAAPPDSRTRVDAEPPSIPAALAAPAPRSQAAEAGPGKRTQPDAEPPVLPPSLATGGPGEPGADPPVGKRTQLDAEPPVLPPSLATGGADRPEASRPAAEPTRLDAEPPVLPPSLASGGPDRPKAGGPAAEPTRLDAEPPVLPRSLDRSGEAPGAVFSLVVTDLGPVARFVLRPGENLVGRGAGAGVRIESPEISRRHAVLTVEGDEVRIRDAGSRNHTYVGDEEVTTDRRLEPGDRLRFGSVAAELLRDTGGS